MVKVYVPCNLQVDVAPDEDHPNGQIVTLTQGYVELPPGLEKNPVLMHLIPQSASEAARQEALYKAQQDHDKAVADADAALAEAKAKAAKEADEEMQKAEEEWAANAAKAAEQGVVYTEPHPDPQQQQAITMTSPSAPVTAGSMTGKAAAPDVQPRARLEGGATGGAGAHRGAQQHGGAQPQH